MTHLCYRCRKQKPPDSFHKSKSSHRGVAGHCKECHKEYRKEYYARPGVMDHRKKVMLAYARANRKKLLAYWKSYHKDRQESHRLYCGIYYRGHKEEQRAKLFLRKYGIRIESYDKMFEAQAGVCAICGEPPKTNRRLALDHCHVTGTVRGLLCNNCNRALGLLYDDPKIIMAAAEYLSKFSKEKMVAAV